MYQNGQTLVHKKSNILARVLLNQSDGDGEDVFDIKEDESLFVNEHGQKFIDKIDNYAPILDALGNVHFRYPQGEAFVDETAKQYILLSYEDRIKARKQAYRKILNTYLTIEDWVKYLAKKKAGSFGEGLLFPRARYENKRIEFYPGKEQIPDLHFITWFLKRNKAKVLYYSFLDDKFQPKAWEVEMFGTKWSFTHPTFGHNQLLEQPNES